MFRWSPEIIKNILFEVLVLCNYTGGTHEFKLKIDLNIWS